MGAHAEAREGGVNLRYGFPEWVRDNLGQVGPADVMRHFDACGLQLSDQQWARLLRNEVASVKLSLWVAICEVTGQPLSSFFEYEPSGGPRLPLLRRRRNAKGNAPVRPAQAVDAGPARPSPFDFYGVER
jgi:hypothetical protein